MLAIRSSASVSSSNATVYRRPLTKFPTMRLCFAARENRTAMATARADTAERRIVKREEGGDLDAGFEFDR